MANMTNYLENKLLAHTLKNIPYSSPGTVYIALLKDSPTTTELEAGTLTKEIVGGAYVRKAVAFNTVTGGVTANTLDIDFPSATADWGNITHIFVMDALTAGNALYWGALPNPRTILTDDILRVPAGNLTVTML